MTGVYLTGTSKPTVLRSRPTPCPSKSPPPQGRRCYAMRLFPQRPMLLPYSSISLAAASLSARRKGRD